MSLQKVGTVISKKTLQKNNFYLPIFKVTDENSRIRVGSGSESVSVSQRYGSPDPDPYQYFTDPQH
jgi:hypothetical protein